MQKAVLCVVGITLFLSGLILGSMMTPASAQERAPLRLNHVQITVPNLEQSLAFYRDVLGFQVAFRLPTPADGRPATAFIQISRDTFLEVAQVAGNGPTGITHIGIETANLDATVAQVRRAGVKLEDPRPPTGIGSRLATVFDPHGIRLEINEQPAGSAIRKATDSWKP